MRPPSPTSRHLRRSRKRPAGVVGEQVVGGLGDPRQAVDQRCRPGRTGRLQRRGKDGRVARVRRGRMQHGAKKLTLAQARECGTKTRAHDKSFRPPIPPLTRPTLAAPSFWPPARAPGLKSNRPKVLHQVGRKPDAGARPGRRDACPRNAGWWSSVRAWSMWLPRRRPGPRSCMRRSAAPAMPWPPPYPALDGFGGDSPGVVGDSPLLTSERCATGRRPSAAEGKGARRWRASVFGRRIRPPTATDPGAGRAGWNAIRRGGRRHAGGAGGRPLHSGVLLFDGARLAELVGAIGCDNAKGRVLPDRRGGGAGGPPRPRLGGERAVRRGAGGGGAWRQFPWPISPPPKH